MELGEKLRQARLEAGLSQRQLCGEEITRNMLSLIENGSARPSMKTLQLLASRLDKPVSYFLDETAVLSPNQEIMTAARRAYDTADYASALEALSAYRTPDPVYDRETDLLLCLCHLALAELALHDRRERYALELLEKAARPTAYCAEDLERRRLLLLGRIRGQQVSSRLPSLDEELLLRAEEALALQNPVRAAHLLDAVETQTSPRFFLLRGEAFLASKDWENAAKCLEKAENDYPAQVIPKLEQCYRELQDYKRAYEYACKQK